MKEVLIQMDNREHHYKQKEEPGERSKPARKGTACTSMRVTHRTGKNEERGPQSRYKVDHKVYTKGQC